MPKKLKKPKSKMFANCKLNHYYSVIGLNDINGNLKYYQVQKNRKKIGNYQNLEVAIRHMMSEANYELQDLFTSTKIIYPGEIVILDYSKTYGWNLKLQIKENEAENLINQEKLIKKQDSYIDSWFTEKRINEIKRKN